MSGTARVARKSGWRDVALRALAAVPLNYAVTAALTMLIARLLPGGAAQASIGATLLSFILFAGIAMAAFAVRSTVKLWLGLVALGLLAGGVDWLLISIGGRL